MRHFYHLETFFLYGLLNMVDFLGCVVILGLGFGLPYWRNGMSTVVQLADYTAKQNVTNQVVEKPPVSEASKNNAIKKLTSAVRYHYHRANKLAKEHRASSAQLAERNQQNTELAEMLHLYEIQLEQKEDCTQPIAAVK